jgi:hypothetical protein
VGAARDGGDEEDAVAFFEGAGFAAEEAYVFFVEIYVEELTDLAGLVADVLREVGEASGQFMESRPDSGAGTVDLRGAVGKATEGRRDFDCYAHFYSSP